MYAMRDLSCFVGRNVFSSIRPSPGTSELRKIVLRWFRVFPFGAIAGRSVKQQKKTAMKAMALREIALTVG